MARRRLEERTITVSDGISINLGVGGGVSSPTLLLLHGLAARWQAFTPLIPRLWEDYRMIAPDFRGHGCSDHAAGTYRLPRLAADVREVVAAFAPDEPLVVYGHSLGGWVALWMAAEDPEMIRGLVIGDTAIDPSSVDPEFAVNYLSDVGMVLRSVGTSMQMLDQEVMTAFREEALTADYDPSTLLSDVTCPVLLLQADPGRGGLMKDSDVDLANTHLAHTSHRRLTGVGHGLHIEDPHAVMDAIVPFLDTLPSAA